MSKERGILFRGEMVRAILEGRKMQTRRPIEPQPECVYMVDHEPSVQRMKWRGTKYRPSSIACPYGQPGDRLWVRETWAACDCYDGRWHLHYPADETCTSPLGTISRFHESALKQYGSKNLRPSIHMPRWASRITLEITKVGVERIQGITAEDAIAEGYRGLPLDCSLCRAQICSAHQPPNGQFANSWDATYQSKGFGWKANPWVWVIEFRRVA